LGAGRRRAMVAEEARAKRAGLILKTPFGLSSGRKQNSKLLTLSPAPLP
jgi:hypothetical protein